MPSAHLTSPTDLQPRPLHGRLSLMGMVSLLLAMAIACTTGCSGCTPNDANKSKSQLEKEQKAKEAKAREKPKPLVEVGPITALLNPPVSEESTGKLTQLVKPGHWTATVQQLKANNEDFVGESSIAIFDNKEKPLRLEYTPFALQSRRPVVLAKGRAKRVEGEIFVPANFRTGVAKATIRRRGASGQSWPKNIRLTTMPAYQYFLVVLAKEPSRYAFLKTTDTIRAPWEEEFDQSSTFHYRVVLTEAGSNAAIPSNALTWTSIAHLVWDEVDPTRLSTEQQNALLDWLHWGGRLIINGPDSLDMLRGSFLDEWLPADNGGPRTVTTSDLQPWNDYWTTREEGKDISPLEPIKPWSAVRLEPRDGATEVAGTAGLFYGRSVGSGIVLVSAIQLHQRELLNWPGYDSFLNAAVLGRPRRKFSKGPYDGLRVTWKDYPKHRLDAHFTTGLRLFSRDKGNNANTVRTETTIPNQYGGMNDVQTHEQIDRPGGLGSWSEQGLVAQAARETLRDAAGVSIPDKGFVAGCLAIYLVVLVPLNWMVFKVLNRVEWAWIAAPIIAVLGTLVVVRQAQLDIGFVRSQTEIALLELQGDYPRGHLSRYTTFYTSLSTTYDLDFDSRTTVATPFPRDRSWKPAVGDRIHDVIFEKHKDTLLRDLTISSNTAQMVHSEQMFELEAALRLGRSSRGDQQVENRTGLNLRDVAVIRRQMIRGKPRYDGCWLGEIRSGSSAILGFTPINLLEDQIPFASDRDRSSADRLTSSLNVDPLLRLAFSFDSPAKDIHYGREQVRLVARVDEVLSGEEATPVASQIQGATVILAHLKHTPPAPPQPDTNTKQDVLKEKVNR